MYKQHVLDAQTIHNDYITYVIHCLTRYVVDTGSKFLIDINSVRLVGNVSKIEDIIAVLHKLFLQFFWREMNCISNSKKQLNCLCTQMTRKKTIACVITTI